MIPVGDPTPHTGDHGSGRAVSDESDVGEVVVDHDVDDVVDVGREADVRARQVLPLTETRERRCDDAMAGGAEQRRNLPPAPPAEPGGVDEDVDTFRHPGFPDPSPQFR